MRERQPLRIAFVCSAAAGQSTDPSLLDVAQGLDARGHELVIIGPRQNPILAAAARAGLRVEPILRRRHFRAATRLIQIVRARRIQLLIADHDLPLHTILWVRDGLGVRIIRLFAPNLPLDPNASVPCPGGPGSPVRAADYVVVHAPEALGAILAHHGPRVGADRLTLIPEAVDTQALAAIDRRIMRRTVRRDLGLRETDPLLVIAGSSGPLGRPDVVIEALARLESKAPPAAWLGEGAALAAIAADAARRGISLLLPGLPPNPAPILGAADVVLLASAGYPLPLAGIQAMALGIPVVAVAVGAHRSLLGGGGEREPPAGLGHSAAPTRTPTGSRLEAADRGLLVPPGNPAELAEAIARALGEPEAGAGAAGRAAAAYVMSHHELRHVTAAWEALLGRALTGGGPGTGGPSR